MNRYRAFRPAGESMWRVKRKGLLFDSTVSCSYPSLCGRIRRPLLFENQARAEAYITSAIAKDADVGDDGRWRP